MSDQPEPIDERALPGAADANAVDASFQNDLLAAWLDDVDAGCSRSLAEYQSMFPAHASEVEVELRALEAAVSDPETITAAWSIDIPDVQLIEIIGRGGQGVVYRGRQTYIERDVAVKVLAPTHWSESFASRFRREATSLASLRHSNIVSCYQAGTTDKGLAYIVMEFIDGPNLGEWLHDNGPMEEIVALRLCRDLALALEQAQRSNIIHRDVKPENVLLLSTPEDESMPFTPKLADLGLARVTADTLEDANLTKLTPFGVVMGSPSTMAPEQFDYADRVDHRTDIYGLGCILYHALAGEPAFDARPITAVIKAKISSGAPDVRKLNPAVRPEVAAFVQSLMAPAADDRPATHSEVASTCSRLLGGTDRAIRQGPRWFVGIAAVVLLAAIIFTRPWSSDERLSVEIAAPRRVNEGQLVEMQAVALGDGDLRYTWRQTEGPKVRLSGIGQPKRALQLLAVSKLRTSASP